MSVGYNIIIVVQIKKILGVTLKIVHLVTSSSGGAANAAFRLNDALIAAGQESKILTVSRRKTLINHDIKVQDSPPHRKILCSALTYSQRVLIQRNSNLITPYSLNLLDWMDSDIESADVIHLHAFYNLVSISNFLNQYPKKLKVVTLHDERFYTGGCHYAGNCTQVISGCKKCPQVNKPFQYVIRRRKDKINQEINDFPNLIILCPSEWIMNRARDAFPDLPESIFKKVYNPVPEPVELSGEHSTSRKLINLGFIAHNLQNPVKNLELLIKAFHILSKLKPNKFRLTLVGNSRIDYSLGNPLIVQQQANSNLELQLALSKIDVLVVPSLNDNLPNVLAEALINGVGLIGSNVGGIPEILNLFDQKLLESVHEDELVEAILDFKLPNKKILKEFARSTFGYDVISSQVINFYREGLNQIATTRHPA